MSEDGYTFDTTNTYDTLDVAQRLLEGNPTDLDVQQAIALAMIDMARTLRHLEKWSQ